MSVPSVKRSRCDPQASATDEVAAEMPSTLGNDGGSFQVQVRLAAQILGHNGIVGETPILCRQLAFQRTALDDALLGVAGSSRNPSEQTNIHHFDKTLLDVIEHSDSPFFASPVDAGSDVSRCDGLPDGWVEPLAKYCLDSGFVHLVEAYFSSREEGTPTGHKVSSEGWRLRIPRCLFRRQSHNVWPDREQVYIDPGPRKISQLLTLLSNTADLDDLILLKQFIRNANHEDIAGVVSLTINRIRKDDVSSCGLEMLQSFEDVALCMYVRTRRELDLALSVRNRSPNGGPSLSQSVENHDQTFVKQRFSYLFLPTVQLTPVAHRELTVPISERRADVYHQTAAQAGEPVGQDTAASTGLCANATHGYVRVTSLSEWERGVGALKLIRERHPNTCDAEWIYSLLQRMQEDAYLFVLKNSSFMSDTRVLIPEADHDCVKSMTSHEFVIAAHCRSFQVARLDKAVESRLGHQYQLLFSELPPHDVNAAGLAHSEPLRNRVQVLLQLVSRHAGEVVEIDRARTTWHLRRKPQSISHSCEGGAQDSGEGKFDSSATAGCAILSPELIKQAQDMLQQIRMHSSTHLCVLDLLPDWPNQESGILVPCKQAPEFQWYRAGPVVTLGELFLALGQRFAASAIYAFYQVLRPVLRISNVKSPCPALVPQTNRDIVIQEYLQARNWDSYILRSVGDEVIFREVMHLVQRVVLLDKRPPWLCDRFPMSVPRDGMFVKLTTPSFLWWGADETATLFGHAVHYKLAGVAENQCLVFAGIIARPLYVCGGVTKLKPFTQCMNAASMSPYLQLPSERTSEHCPLCQNKVLRSESDSDLELTAGSSPLRVLWAYPLVQGLDGSPICLRVPEPTRLIVHAPPSNWTWPGQLCPGTAKRERARPAVGGGYCEYYAYSICESGRIWEASASFRVPPSLSVLDKRTHDFLGS